MNPDSSNNIYVKPLYYLDYPSVKIIDKEFDFIFHCAVIGGRRYDNNEKEIYDKNLELFSLLKEIIKNKIRLNLRIFNIYGRYINNSNNFIDLIIDSCLLNNEINLIEDRYFDIFYIENLRSILL